MCRSGRSHGYYSIPLPNTLPNLLPSWLTRPQLSHLHVASNSCLLSVISLHPFFILILLTVASATQISKEIEKLLKTCCLQSSFLSSLEGTRRGCASNLPASPRISPLSYACSADQPNDRDCRRRAMGEIKGKCLGLEEVHSGKEVPYSASCI